MVPIRADELSYEEFEIFGKKGLFTNLRVDRNSLPDGLYAYDLRDECDGDINELKSFVVVNHFGTVILGEPIDGADEGVPVSCCDYCYLGGCRDLDSYASKLEKEELKISF